MSDIKRDCNLPLVSIGIPTYNRPVLLRRALNCVLNQTYKNLEIVVSDNCSTDPDVKALLDEFKNKDERLKIFIQTRNIGPSNNFNFVKQKATGKYFMWLADDDIISEQFVEKTVTFLEANGDYSMASGMPFRVEQQIPEPRPLPVLSLENSSKQKRLSSYIFNVADNCVFYSLFHKNQIDSAWRALPSYIASDQLLIIRLLYFGKSKILPDVSVFKSFDGISNQDPKTFAASFKTSMFWFNHRNLQLYRYLLKDIFCNNCFGHGIFEKVYNFLFFSLVCFICASRDFSHEFAGWLDRIVYRQCIKRYFFHIFYLLLPEKAFCFLKGIKQKIAQFCAAKLGMKY